MEIFQSPIVQFNNNLTQHFSNIYLFVILNIFFIIATYTDLRYMKIYDKFNIALLITRIITAFIFGFSTNLLLGGLVIFLAFLFSAMYTKDKIAGDIKFGGNVGLWLGFIPSIAFVVLTILTNLIHRVFTGNKKKIPLAPYFYLSYLIFTLYYFLILT